MCVVSNFFDVSTKFGSLSTKPLKCSPFAFLIVSLLSPISRIFEMSSQKNIVSLFRIRKPLIKRVRHQKETSQTIQIAASVTTPPASSKKKVTRRVKSPSVSKSKSVVEKESPTLAAHLNTPPTKTLFRHAELESSKLEKTPQVGLAASLPTSSISSRPRFSEVLSLSVTPSGLDDLAALEEADIQYNDRLEYISDDDDDDDACEIRENRRIDPEDDPLLSHILDNFTGPSG